MALNQNDKQSASEETLLIKQDNKVIDQLAPAFAYREGVSANSSINSVPP